MIQLLREEFNPADQRDFQQYLREEDRSFYQAREQSIRDLQQIQENFFSKLQDFTITQTEQHEAKVFMCGETGKSDNRK